MLAGAEVGIGRGLRKRWRRRRETAIDRELPQAHIVSIGHRATLREMHDAIVTMEPNEDGTFTPTPTAKAPVA